jgi:hypothetical protein
VSRRNGRPRSAAAPAPDFIKRQFLVFFVTYILPPLLSPFASPPPIFISIIKNQLVYRPFFVFKFLPLFYLFQPTPNANNNINGIQKKKGNEEKNKIK